MQAAAYAVSRHILTEQIADDHEVKPPPWCQATKRCCVGVWGWLLIATSHCKDSGARSACAPDNKGTCHWSVQSAWQPSLIDGSPCWLKAGYAEIKPYDNCSRACIRLQAGLTNQLSESLSQSNIGWTRFSTFSFHNIHSVQKDPRMRISLGEGDTS